MTIVYGLSTAVLLELHLALALAMVVLAANPAHILALIGCGVAFSRHP